MIHSSAFLFLMSSASENSHSEVCGKMYVLTIIWGNTVWWQVPGKSLYFYSVDEECISLMCTFNHKVLLGIVLPWCSNVKCPLILEVCAKTLLIFGIWSFQTLPSGMFCLPQAAHLWFLFCFVRVLTKVLQRFLNEVRDAIWLCPD